MKKRIPLFFALILVLSLAACGKQNGKNDVTTFKATMPETTQAPSEQPTEELEVVDLDSVEELYHIQITAGEYVLSGILYDTETSRAFASMLPLTVDLWHPAPGFARAFDLPERIPRYESAGYEYELGSLAYWYEGPSIALIYQASRDKTVVPVVPMGKITSDVSVFQEYEDAITIELVEE